MKKADAFRDKHYEIWWLLGDVFYALKELRDKELSKFNTTSWQAYVLFLAKLKGREATPANISRWIHREPHTVSGLLNRMENQKLVKRVRDLKQKNRVRIVLTKKGEEAYKHTTERASLHRSMAFLDNRGCDELISYLKLLRDASFKELGIKYDTPYPFI